MYSVGESHRKAIAQAYPDIGLQLSKWYTLTPQQIKKDKENTLFNFNQQISIINK
jgi:hypothetical protein